MLKQQQQQAEAAPMRNETMARDLSMGTNEDVVLVGNLIGEDHINYVVQYVDGYLDWHAFHFYLSFSYADRNHTLKRPIPIDNGRPEPDTFPLTMGPAGRPRIMTEPCWQWIGRGCLPLCY